MSPRNAFHVGEVGDIGLEEKMVHLISSTILLFLSL